MTWTLAGQCVATVMCLLMTTGRHEHRLHALMVLMHRVRHLHCMCRRADKQLPEHEQAEQDARDLSIGHADRVVTPLPNDKPDHRCGAVISPRVVWRNHQSVLNCRPQ